MSKLEINDSNRISSVLQGYLNIPNYDYSHSMKIQGNTYFEFDVLKAYLHNREHNEMKQILSTILEIFNN